MASLDDILAALTARAEYLRNKDNADLVLRLINQYKNNKSVEGSAAYEYGKLMNEQIAKQNIDLDFVNQFMTADPEIRRRGYSPDLIKLGNLWNPPENGYLKNVTYNLPSNILNKITNDLLLRAVIDVDPVANAIVNPQNDANFRSSLERALLEKYDRNNTSNDNDLRSSLKEALLKK